MSGLLQGISFGQGDDAKKRASRKEKKHKKEKKKKRKKHKKGKANNRDAMCESSSSSGEDAPRDPLISPLNRLGANNFESPTPQVRSFEEIQQQAATSIPETKSFEELLAKARGDVATENDKALRPSTLASGRAKASLTPLKRKADPNSRFDPNRAAADMLRRQLAGGPSLSKPSHDSVGGTERGITKKIERDDLRYGSKRGKRKTNLNYFDKNRERTGYFKADVESFGEGSASGSLLTGAAGRFHKAGEAPKGARSTSYPSFRGATDEDYDKNFIRNVLKQGKNYKSSAASRTGEDEEEDVDVSLYENKKNWMTALKRGEVERSEAAMADKRWDRQVSTDRFNVQNTSFPSHLIVSMGTAAYMMVPRQKQLTKGHCIIAPIEPIKSMNHAGIDLREQVAAYKTALLRMFSDEKPQRSVVFLETVRNMERAHHTHIHAIPVDEEVAETAHLAFSQALRNADTEWASHKAVIDTAKKGLSNSIPARFPYFHVQIHSLKYENIGLAHVIEDSSKFSDSFGMDVISGMLGLPPRSFNKKGNKATFSEQRDTVMSFTSTFQRYNPCKQKK
jgi:diadenosine tetraphosphate (Ap4A) HIT family hydrolase